MNETTGVTLRDIPIVEKGIKSWNFSQLSFSPNFFEYGVYKFTYNFQIKASIVYTLKATNFAYLRIVKVSFTGNAA